MELGKYKQVLRVMTKPTGLRTVVYDDTMDDTSSEQLGAREGFAEGTNPKKKQMVLDMMKRGADSDTISTITGLTSEQINQIIQEQYNNKPFNNMSTDEYKYDNKPFKKISMTTEEADSTMEDSSIPELYPGLTGLEVMPEFTPGIEPVMPTAPGMEDPRLRQIELANGGTPAGKKTEKITRVGRPVYETPEGEMVSEQSRTLKLGNLYYNVPSIHDGMKYTDEQLVELLDKNLISPTSVHSSLQGAIDESKFRSSTLFDTEENYGQQLSAREGSFADGGVVEREKFGKGSEILQSSNPELYKQIEDLKEKYKGKGVHIFAEKARGSDKLNIRLDVHDYYRKFLDKNIKKYFDIEKFGETLIPELEKNINIISSNISKERAARKELVPGYLREYAKEKSIKGAYGTREETVKQINKVVEEVANGERPILDVIKLRRGELLDTPEYKKPSDFLAYDYAKSKPRYLTKQNYKIYEKEISPYLKSISSTVYRNVNPVATEEFKNATLQNIDDLLQKYPSKHYGIPKNAGEHLMRSIERHADKGGKKFEIISGDNVSNYVAREKATGKKFSADIVNSDPTNKRWKKYVDAYNGVKEINYGTQFIDKTTGNLITPTEAYRKITGIPKGVPVEFEHFDKAGVFGDPIDNVGISFSRTNKAANLKGLDDETLKKVFGRMSNIDTEGNKKRTVKFLEKLLIKQKMDPTFKLDTPTKVLEKLNPIEKQTFSKFGKLSMGFDPIDAMKNLSGKEVGILKKGISKLGNVAKMGAIGAEGLLIGGPVGAGIVAAFSIPEFLSDVSEGKTPGEAFQNVASSFTLGAIPRADKRSIEEIGGPEAGIGFEIQQNIDKVIGLQEDLREAENKPREDMMDPEADFAQSAYLDNTRREIDDTFKLLEPYVDKQGKIIGPEYQSYLQAKNKLEQKQAYRKAIGQMEAYNYGLDDMTLPEEGAFAQDISKASKGLKKLEGSYYENKQPNNINFWGGVDTNKVIPAEDLINMYAYGGRVKLKDAGDPKDKPILPINPMMDEGPQDPSKRGFLKGMAGLGALGAGIKAGLIGLGKVGQTVKAAKAAPLTEIVAPIGKTQTEFPTWFPSLIKRVREEGKQIPIFKQVDVPLTEAQFNKLQKEGAKGLEDRHLARSEEFIRASEKRGEPRYVQVKDTDEIIGYKYEVKDMPDLKVKEMRGEQITVEFPNDYRQEVYMTYEKPKVSIDSKNQKVKYDAEFSVEDGVPELNWMGQRDDHHVDFYSEIVNNLDEVYGGASRVEQYALKAKKPRFTQGDEVVARAEGRFEEMMDSIDDIE